MLNHLTLLAAFDSALRFGWQVSCRGLSHLLEEGGNHDSFFPPGARLASSIGTVQHTYSRYRVGWYLVEYYYYRTVLYRT